MNRTRTSRPVDNTKELQRVLHLPRRTWSEESATELSRRLTPILKNPIGTETLRPYQAQALYDIGVYGGGVANGRVGCGKTLIGLLARCVLPSPKYILLVVPAQIKIKTERAIDDCAKHWRVPKSQILLQTYETLGRHAHAEWLVQHAPNIDLAVFDEAHRLKNKKAAVTARVLRMGKMFPHIRFVLMSGTFTRKSLLEYEHLLRLVYKENAPIPLHFPDLQAWDSALSETGLPGPRCAPGALLEFANDDDRREAVQHVQELNAKVDASQEWWMQRVAEEELETITARIAYRRRLRETPGFLTSLDRFTGSSVYMTGTLQKKLGPEVEGAFKMLREQALRPDGWAFGDMASQVWACARQLSLGFYYRWDPKPPDEWMARRKDWAKFSRDVLKSNHQGWDTEKQVALACSHDQLDRTYYDRWREIEPTFSPNTRCVWLSDVALVEAEKWLSSHKSGGICWVEHVEFGRELSRRTGLPYFQQGGADAKGNQIMNATGPVIASVHSCKEGQNLQHYSDNLLVTPPSNAKDLEQLMGRTVRDGQREDEVHFEVFVGCSEHLASIEKCIAQAKYVTQSTGQSQIVLYTDLTLPSQQEIASVGGTRFSKS